jgi:hypothetical protein
MIKDIIIYRRRGTRAVRSKSSPPFMAIHKTPGAAIGGSSFFPNAVRQVGLGHRAFIKSAEPGILRQSYQG